MPTAVFDSIQFLNPVKHNYGVLKPFKYIDLANPKSGASIFIWQSYYSRWKIKIEPTIKLNYNIYMSVPSRLPFGRAIRAFTSGLLRGEGLLFTILLLWEVPQNHHILETYYFHR